MGLLLCVPSMLNVKTSLQVPQGENNIRAMVLAPKFLQQLFTAYHSLITSPVH